MLYRIPPSVSNAPRGMNARSGRVVPHQLPIPRVMNRVQAAAALWIVLLLPGRADALDPSRAVTQYDTEVWFAKDGLPQNSVYAIAQTPDGYLWFGTEEGLARFDGVQFTTFDPKNGSLVHRYVVALAPDEHREAQRARIGEPTHVEIVDAALPKVPQ